MRLRKTVASSTHLPEPQAFKGLCSRGVLCLVLSVVCGLILLCVQVMHPSLQSMPPARCTSWHGPCWCCNTSEQEALRADTDTALSLLWCTAVSCRCDICNACRHFQLLLCFDCWRRMMISYHTYSTLCTQGHECPVLTTQEGTDRPQLVQEVLVW